MSKVLSPKVLGTLVIVIIGLLASNIIAPVPLAGIQLPAEWISFGFIGLPNTLIATLLTDLTILILVFAATRNMQDVPSGLQNVMEIMIESWYDLAEGVAGHNAKKFFPWVVTIFLLVLVSNWWELVPGFDSIGWLETHAAIGSGDSAEEYTALTHYKVTNLVPGVYTIVSEPYKPTYDEYHHAHEDHKLPTNENGEKVAVLVPFFRAAATDLNFTFALALIAMFMVQFYGVQALGLSYFSKFFNFKGGAMGIFMGLIELISEFAKILSFAFRLFGNIFGGQVLLFVMAFLVPWFLPVPFYGLELFVGFIQAFVFAILTLVFFALAVISHDEEHH
ncbi:MAG: F0F1 ATP synthase subunit A [Ardenticatenaceae bacterium]